MEEDRKGDGPVPECEDLTQEELDYIDAANAKIAAMHRFVEAQGCTPAPNDKVPAMGSFAEGRKENTLGLE